MTTRTIWKRTYMAIMIIAILGGGYPTAAIASSQLTIEQKAHTIEQFVQQHMQASRIPGISVVIVEKGNTVYQQGFGYADVAANKPVTGNTLFELASTSKAFTGLAILQLEQEGKLKRTDDVTNIIPWLTLSYKDEPALITINDLLFHTSGIPATSIQYYPESHTEDSLERTVSTLLSQPLNREPGSSYEYATINYDILGLVIEQVTKQSFEDYMQQHILQPLNMNDSIVGVQPSPPAGMAVGYRLRFTKPSAYTPPIYRGNTPAGYIISNTNDIAKWLNVQLAAEPHPTSEQSAAQPIDPQLISNSHIPDKSVKPLDKHTYYAAGWAVEQQSNNKHVIFHAGANPTYSSYITMLPEEQIGVAVLANMQSSTTTAISQGVMDIWQGKKPASQRQPDGMLKLDQIATSVFFSAGCLVLLCFCLILGLVRKLVRQQRSWVSLYALTWKRCLFLVIHIVICATGLFVVINLPNLLLGGMPWSFINRWSPATIALTYYSVIGMFSLYFMYGMLLVFTNKRIGA
ncbi:serine hydrolase domain-containing protein [Paenibacillus sp. 481]|uniref:serine hydrolase domain-containing protein n=1 Tax=Paenibacillus sp. 481 TaxID=2835869 RepID=UPI001E529B2D|nr:serine hydrolase domain-containing protein [Paenibacillus sp. 481]UHA73484.1 beta-lactamase family protein [Paenibacillus sp. 481]